MHPEFLISSATLNTKPYNYIFHESKVSENHSYFTLNRCTL